MEALRHPGPLLAPVSLAYGHPMPLAMNNRYQRPHLAPLLAKRGYEPDDDAYTTSDDSEEEHPAYANHAGLSPHHRSLKRRCSSSGASQDSSGTEQGDLDTQHDTGAFEGCSNPERACAEVLQLLRTGSWSDADKVPVFQLQSLRVAEPKGAAAGSKSRRRSHQRGGGAAPRRKYTWRSFHHRGKAEDAAQHSSEEESVPAAAPAAPAPPLPTRQLPTDEDAPSGSSHKERDKEWAALTTWLRMNLHQPRTNKRVVLFTADSPAPGQPWVFHLNPELTWDDVSEETKLRLKTLPQETEAAFAHKYPGRPSSEWQTKTQKYRPAGDSVTIQVPLGEMVYSLRDMCSLFESEESS